MNGLDWCLEDMNWRQEAGGAPFFYYKVILPHPALTRHLPKLSEANLEPDGGEAGGRRNTSLAQRRMVRRS